MASYSMAKTIVGMLVGIAISEGRIRSIDDRADAYVPALAGTPYGETPIRHLLTMSSGIRFSETYGGSDDVAVLARLSMGRGSEGGAATVAPFRIREHAPGERFNYSSADTQVLGLVLRAATGVPLADYLSEKIWRPMGAEADASWTIDKRRLRDRVLLPQRDAARLRAARHAARERRRARRPADRPRAVGARGDHAAVAAVRTGADGRALRVRLPDVDRVVRPRAPVRAVGDCAGRTCSSIPRASS